MSEQRDGTFLGAVGWTVVLLVVIAVVGFIVILLARPSPPAPRTVLLSDWDRLNTATSFSATAPPSKRVAPLQRFAGQVGQLSLPGADASDAHTLIRAAITVSEDDSNAYWSTDVGEMCNLGTTGCWIYPTSYSADTSAFNADFRTLYADLGGGG